ncbi:MAG: ferrous iron transporter B [Bacilli bacterium]|jgi:ferrous iron transport protein B|nr:ferrous iron transporter B [Bacilli bacterium]MDD3069140.1 ferrous iron transporter B [Bacilli bacterium]MDD3841575.1 ferrous iron transporter B [Bacilli bacterium]HKM10426.1 ferrous iron transporter B [Bacilli bacterium]
MKRFALAGNPNCGKTTLFNSLTGSSAYVGNWPGVTVEKKEGKYKKCKEPISIVDLPGIYSLSPYTSEEVISRNFIIDEKPDCVINVVDSTNLERNLYLTTQLLEIDVPVIIALNMMDAVRKSGDSIDPLLLEKEVGVPVVCISASKEEGLDELMDRAYEESLKKREATSVLLNSNLSHLINDIELSFKGLKVDNPLFHAIKLVENDEIEIKNHPQLLGVVDEFKKYFKDETFGSDLEAIVADSRYKHITSNFSKAKKKNNNEMAKTFSTSDKIDRVLTNKWLGIPIFLLLLFFIFHMTFSENLFFLGGLFTNIAPSFEGTFFEGLFWTSSGINSIGVVFANLLGSTTSWLTDVVQGWLSTSPQWVSGLITNGMLGGVFAVLSFLPQILLLFLFFSILEDSGYMARVAFILDRLFRRFGLTGRSLMPMIMGFGCSIPAMINTRTLSNDNEKIATIRVIPFFSCGAKLPILTAVAGGIIQQFGIGNADIITFSMYLLGMGVAIVSILLMRATIMRGAVPPFIMELPAYHLPQFKALMIHLWDKAKHFLKKAFTVILAFTIIIWFFSHFSFSWQYLEDVDIDKSILAGLGQLVTPLFTPLGFGSQLSSFSWVFVVAAFSGLIAKENVISTFGVLGACVAGSIIDVGGDGGIAAVATMIQGTGITIPALISFIAFNLLTIPCFAAVVTAKAELPKNKFVGTLVFWLATSYIVSSMIYLIGSWWWTSFIFLGAFGIGVFAIYLVNKHRDNKQRTAK